MTEDRLTDVLITKLDETEIHRVLAELKKAWLDSKPKVSDIEALCITANFVNYVVWSIEQQIYKQLPADQKDAILYAKHTFLNTLFMHWKMDPMQVAIDLSKFETYINITKPEEK